MKKEKKFEKVVEWEKGNFITEWFLVITIAIFYPIFYFQEYRKVYYKEIKE